MILRDVVVVHREDVGIVVVREGIVAGEGVRVIVKRVCRLVEREEMLADDSWLPPFSRDVRDVLVAEPAKPVVADRSVGHLSRRADEELVVVAIARPERHRPLRPAAELLHVEMEVCACVEAGLEAGDDILPIGSGRVDVFRRLVAASKHGKNGERLRPDLARETALAADYDIPAPDFPVAEPEEVVVRAFRKRPASVSRADDRTRRAGLPVLVCDRGDVLN